MRRTINDLQRGSRLIHQYTLTSRTQQLQLSLVCALSRYMCASVYTVCVCELGTMTARCPTESRFYRLKVKAAETSHYHRQNSELIQ